MYFIFTLGTMFVISSVINYPFSILVTGVTSKSSLTYYIPETINVNKVIPVKAVNYY